MVLFLAHGRASRVDYLFQLEKPADTDTRVDVDRTDFERYPDIQARVRGTCEQYNQNESRDDETP